MNNNPKFSFKKWNNNRKETLSFFGFNRFNDWVIVLMISFVGMVFFGVVGFVVYNSTKSTVSNNSTVEKNNYAEKSKEIESKIKLAVSTGDLSSISSSSTIYIDPSR